MYKAGYRYVDGKYELGLNWSCDPVIIDTCGTQDECRIAHRKTGEQHSKEPLRQYLESHPWFSELQAAKKTYPDDKSKWPPYPVVPHEIVVTTQQLYRQFAEDYEQARIEMYGA
jgi:phosphoribosylaminoimidazole-succinocarboxamide synthase